MNRFFLGLSLALFISPATLSAQITPYQNHARPTFLVSTPWAFAAGQVEPSAIRRESFSRLAVGASVSSLGTGVGLGTNLSPKLDARIFGNFLNLTHRYTDQGFNIALNIELPNAGAMVDFYPVHHIPFRISPGYLFVNQNRVRVDVHSEQSNIFSLNNVDFRSDDADPVRGTGRLLMRGNGFMITAGLGHIVSHNYKNFTFPFEAGVAFIDKPTVVVQLAGQVCSSQLNQCQSVATYPGFSTDLAAQVASWNRTAAPYHVFPILRGGVSYSFNIR